MCAPLLEWIDAGERYRLDALNASDAVALRWGLKTGALKAAGTVEWIPCPQCLDEHQSRVLREGTGFRGYCPSTCASVAVPATSVAAIQGDFAVFAASIAAACGVSGAPRERSKDLLWEIGWIESGGARRSLFLCRGINSTSALSAVAADLDQRGSKWPGLVLCVGAPPTGLRLKNGHRFCSLQECLMLRDGRLEVDRLVLDQWTTDLRRPRKLSTERDRETEAEWRPHAVAIWHHLDARGELSANLTVMSRRVSAELRKIKPPIVDPPEPRTVAKGLHDLHRAKYPGPAARRRTRDRD